ncbi:MAG: hypothetical protein SFW62_09450 [Alphaproteobacteria bacterium]|nr:hypothetical protein [Alphaproteobacteria bacterium]
MTATQIITLPSGRPDWLTITDEQAAKARRIITRDFWNSDRPFDQPAYKEIGFPCRVGYLTAKNVQNIYQSSEYRDVDEGRNLRYVKPYILSFIDRPEPEILHYSAYTTVPAFLMEPIRQFMICDYSIYKQERVFWSFDVDICKLYKGSFHRGDGEWHSDVFGDSANMDETLDNEKIKNCARNFREGRFIPPYNSTGMPRIYIAASSFSTQFEAVSTSAFSPWDIIHYTVEKHASPPSPGPCTRFLLRCSVTPI